MDRQVSDDVSRDGIRRTPDVHHFQSNSATQQYSHEPSATKQPPHVQTLSATNSYASSTSLPTSGDTSKLAESHIQQHNVTEMPTDVSSSAENSTLSDDDELPESLRALRVNETSEIAPQSPRKRVDICKKYNEDLELEYVTHINYFNTTSTNQNGGQIALSLITQLTYSRLSRLQRVASFWAGEKLVVEIALIAANFSSLHCFILF